MRSLSRASGAIVALRFADLIVVVTVASVIEWGRRGHDASDDIARVFSMPPGVAAPTRPTADFAAAIFGVLAGPIIWGALTAAGLGNRHRRRSISGSCCCHWYFWSTYHFSISQASW